MSGPAVRSSGNRVLTAESSSEDSITAGPSLEIFEAPRLAPQSAVQEEDSPQTFTLPLAAQPSPVLPEATLATPLEPLTQTGPPTSVNVQSEEVQGEDTTEPTGNDQARSNSTRSSGRSKKPTRFFGEPFRHSVKSIKE